MSSSGKKYNRSSEIRVADGLHLSAIGSTRTPVQFTHIYINEVFADYSEVAYQPSTVRIFGEVELMEWQMQSMM